MTDPSKNNVFAGSERGDSGGFSANQSKPWRHGELWIITKNHDSKSEFQQ